jgi:nicotinamidase-related amidase
MLDVQNSALVVVDIQGKLAELMHDKEIIFKNVEILIKAAKILEIPILWCQQVPHALGPTIPQLAELLTDCEPIDKASFSCCGHESFKAKLAALTRRQIILTGIETHVCIYQTATDLLAEGYSVDIVADAVSSRTLANKQIALRRLTAQGANITLTEMALFELLKTADHPKFKKIAKLIK